MVATVLGWSGVSLGLLMLVLMAASDALVDAPPTHRDRSDAPATVGERLSPAA
ncbi:hypothetical protein GTS_25090 [Gandjariella thermophila]|uniref:Uncharacterized protein n=2 Tax=Gandjariella thermophila TaxID=1931992 RepID=A0A4D4J8Q3_9PSEU|nr:hypothetical protein GTS_25090 [Gandjariella thermophila]